MDGAPVLRNLPRALAITGVLAALCGVAACGNDTEAACETIQTESRAVLDRVKGVELKDRAQIYRDSATKIRDAGKEAGGDVQKAADKLATELDEAADRSAELKTAFAGSSYVRDNEALAKACS
jgi:hypothetical protein